MAKQVDNVNLESVEIDAAPSVVYLDDLDIPVGSEVIVRSEQQKQDVQKNKELNILKEKLKEAEGSDSCYENGTSVDKHKLEIESGLGSLNLGDKIVGVNSEQAGHVPSFIDENEDLLYFLEQQDSDGDTLLHIMIICLSRLPSWTVEIIGALGGNLNIQNNLLQTPLHLAVITRQENVARNLLSAGASPSCRDHELQTPMHIACKKGNYAMLETLLHHGSWSDVTSGVLVSTHPLNLPNGDGERCLHLAVKANDVAMTGLLVSNGADVNLPDRKSGQTPLHVAAKLGLVEMVQYLISLPDIDINQKTYNDETAIEIAFIKQRFEIVDLLKPKSFPVRKSWP